MPGRLHRDRICVAMMSIWRSVSMPPAPAANAGIAVPLRDKGVAVGDVGRSGRERAPARSQLAPGIDHQDRADLRQGFEVRQKAMKFRVMLDTVPVEAADTVIDPRKYQRIGLDRTKRIFVQLAGLDGDPLFGLELD